MYYDFMPVYSVDYFGDIRDKYGISKLVNNLLPVLLIIMFITTFLV